MMRGLAVFFALMALSGSALAEPDLAWGEDISFDQCEQLQGAIWAEFDRGETCLRYFTAGDITGAVQVVVVLRGDRDRWIGHAPAEIPDNSAQEQTAIARKLSHQMDLPVVVLSRPGTYGSSGDHRRRRQAEEFLSIDKALDGLRKRYDIGHFVLLGHSGGATAAAALLTMGRRDISCAVLTSGVFDLIARAEARRAARGRKSKPGIDTTGLPDPYDPLYHVSGITADTQRTIHILGNSQDIVTPFQFQKAFYQALITHGHRAELKDVAAKAPNYHDLSGSIGPKTAAACASQWRP